MDLPRALRLWIKFRMMSVEVTSSPDSGSSRTRMSGLSISAAISRMRCRIPLEYEPIVTCLCGHRENRRKREAMTFFLRGLGMARNVAAMSRYSSPVK